MPFRQQLCSEVMAVGLRHLRAFLAIADEGSITAAADVLRVTQPALSRTLRQLEEHLGVGLVDRTTRRLSLTPAGEELQVRAAAAVAAVDAALDPALVATWPIRLGHAWSALGEDTARVMARWRERHPGTPLRLQRVDDRLAGLAGGEADVAVVRHPVRRAGLRSRPLRTERRVLAVAADHRLAYAEGPVHLADLAGEPLVVNVVSGTTTPALWPAESRPGEMVEVTTTDDWLAVIAAGGGLGVTSTATEQTQHYPGVVYRPVADAPPLRVWLAWPDPPVHPATQALVRLVEEVVGERPTG